MSAHLIKRLELRQRLVPVHRLLPMAAACWLIGALPAAAFSQIGSQDGSDRQKDGIVSVPLPPLPGAVEPARAEKPASPSTPSPSSTPTAPAAPAPVPSTGAATPAPAASPAPTTAAPADAGTTDEGEVDAPATDDAPAAADDDSGDGDDAADPPTTEEPGADAAPDASDDAAAGGDAADGADADAPPAQIYYGEDGLPPAVRDLRAKLIEICRAGDIEALRPYLQTGEDATVITFGDAEGDPITALKAASGDGQGVEILAILLEVLQAGHVRSEPDTDDEIFVWPYFTGVPIAKLTNPQKVELFELVTAGDYQEMLGFGAYNFYRAGISPDGKLQFFVAGD